MSEEQEKRVWVLEYRRKNEPQYQWHYCGLAESEKAAKLSFRDYGHSDHWFTLKGKYYQYMRGSVVTYRIHQTIVTLESDFQNQE